MRPWTPTPQFKPQGAGTLVSRTTPPVSSNADRKNPGRHTAIGSPDPSTARSGFAAYPASAPRGPLVGWKKAGYENVHTPRGGTSGYPARSRTPVPISTVNVSPTPGGSSGISVSRAPPSEATTVTGTAFPRLSRSAIDSDALARSTGSEKVTAMGSRTHAVADDGAGVRPTTSGGVRSTKIVKGPLVPTLPPHPARAMISRGPSAAQVVSHVYWNGATSIASGSPSRRSCTTSGMQPSTTTWITTEPLPCTSSSGEMIETTGGGYFSPSLHPAAAKTSANVRNRRMGSPPRQ